MTRSVSFVLFLCINLLVVAQNNTIDSLIRIFNNTRQDTIRMVLYQEMGDFYKNSNPDSAAYYYKKAIVLADKNKDNQQDSYKKLKANSLRFIGMLYRNQGLYDLALDNYNKSLIIAQKINDQNGILLCYNNMGLVYADLGSNDKAIEYYLKSLKIAERIDNKKGMSMGYNNMGLIYSDQKIYHKAIEYFTLALKIKEKLNDKGGMSLCLNNIGIVYDEQGKHKNALEYYLKSLKIREEINDKIGMIACYNNIGTVHYSLGQYDNANEYFLKSLNKAIELGSKKEIGTGYNNLGFLNTVLADTASLNENQRLMYLKNAIDFGKKALEIAQEIKAVPSENRAAETLMKAYKKQGNYKESIKYAELYISTKDSLLNEEKTKALAEMSEKYESEKKRLELDKMQKQKELDNKTIEAQEAKSKQQQIIIFYAIGGLLIVLIFSIVILRLFSQKRKANILLAIQNAEILQQKEEISAQRDEISAQRDTVILQKNNIEIQKKEITDSITYAKRIQQALIPSGEYANSLLGEHFILFKPKDIVSGDFYWSTKINNWLIVTVADCTGHGVPGAFMSMLGISYLNEIVRKKEIINSSEILINLRTSIVEALHQKGEMGEQKDGMDISLLVINTDTNEAQWAGANNPLYIIRKFDDLKMNQFESDKSSSNLQISQLSNQFIELKGDKMPIAIYPEMKNFTNHEFTLQKGDCIYLFTDGYADQFGGTKGRKFMYKPFKEMLVLNSNKTMSEIKQILETKFEQWRGGYKQIDDITVMGLRIGK